MKDLIRGIWKTDRPRTAFALATMFAVSLTEGTAVLLLLPLLQIAGIDVRNGPLKGFDSSLAAVFSRLGMRPSLLGVLAAYVVVIMVQASLTRLQTLTDERVVLEYAQATRARLYDSIANAEWLALTRIRSSDFTFALTTGIDRISTAAHRLLYVFATGAVAILYTILALKVSAAMSGIVIACAVLLLLWQRRKTSSAAGPGEDLNESTSGLYATASEQLGGLKTAKSYGNEQIHVAAFLNQSLEVNKAELALARSYAGLKWRQTVGSVIALAVVLYLAVSVFHIPTAALLLLLLFFSRLVPRLASVQQTLQYVIGALPALRMIESLILACERAAEHDSVGRVSVEHGSIELESIRFAYPGAEDRRALSDVEITIPEGLTTALVGPSGSGKTTIADLLLGLIRPDAGRVAVGSITLDPEHLASWRSQIGYVAQDTYLFNASVRANLDWARAGATTEEMQEALRQAAADEFVEALSNGIDTVIGERGVRLSGGEKQRLSLARALLRKPKLLILDEATSALDSENEAKIYAAIEKLHGEMTILIITHRLSTIRNADLIHVIDQGRVVTSGTWASLMTGNNPRFRELCMAQGLSADSVAASR